MDDTVSRAAAIDVMCELMRHWFGGDPKDEVREIKRELEKLPAVQTCEDAVSRADVIELVKDSYYNLAESMEDTWAMVADVEKLPAAQPQRKTDEWCTDCKEYDSEKHCCPRWNRVIRQTLSEQTEWNNHTVACLLAELFGDACACNYNGIDEWLPEKCEVIDACPEPVGVACWEQFLKHRAERRTDEQNS